MKALSNKQQNGVFAVVFWSDTQFGLHHLVRTKKFTWKYNTWKTTISEVWMAWNNQIYQRTYQTLQKW